MGSPDILTRINQFLVLLPNFHNEQLKKEEESKDSFNLLLEEFLNEKREFLDTTNTLKIAKQIWQIVQEKNQETTTNSQLEGIIKDEDKKREYFSSLILSCLFPGKGDGGDYYSEDSQNTNEKLFFYSSRYSSNQLEGGEGAPLRILKEAIGTLVGKKPEDGILEDFKEPEPMDFDLMKNDLFSKDPFFEEEVENDDQAQEGVLKNQTEGGYSREGETGQNQLVDFFKSGDFSFRSKQGTGLEEKAGQNAHHSLEDRQGFLFKKNGIEDLFSKEEESFPDDSKDSGDKTFLSNGSNQGHRAESLTNLQAGQTRTTISKFIREETEEEIARIISRIKLLKEAGQTEVRMELDLEQLGKLKVKITKEDGELQTDFLAENLEAKELIESNISALRDALLSLGFDSVSIKTTVQQGNNDFFRQGQKKPSLAGLSYGSEEEIEDDDLLGGLSISWRGETLNLVA